MRGSRALPSSALRAPSPEGEGEETSAISMARVRRTGAGSPIRTEVSLITNPLITNHYALLPSGDPLDSHRPFLLDRHLLLGAHLPMAGRDPHTPPRPSPAGGECLCDQRPLAQGHPCGGLWPGGRAVVPRTARRREHSLCGPLVVAGHPPHGGGSTGRTC